MTNAQHRAVQRKLRTKIQDAALLEMFGCEMEKPTLAMLRRRYRAGLRLLKLVRELRWAICDQLEDAEK